MITKIIKEGSSINISMYLDDEQTKVGYILAELDNNVINANSTVVDPSFRGQNIAGQLVDALINFATKNNYKIKPICSYIAKYFDKNPDKVKKVI